MEAAEGEAIAEDDILAMFVWIPRYAYKITNGYHTVANGTGDIQIKFLNEATDNYNGGTALRQTDTNAVTNGNKYVVHPAFTEGNIGAEIRGMWVGKFESSNYTSPKNNEGITASSSENLLYGKGDNQNVTIKPNVTSWRYTTVPVMYDVCQAMNDEGNIHGLTSTADTMMMKNSQWGAVAYLVQSNYGNKQIASDDASGIWNNPYVEGYIYESADNSEGYGMDNRCTTLTGMVGTSRDQNTSYYSKVQEGEEVQRNNKDSITINYNKIDKVADGGGPNGALGYPFPRTYYRYNTTEGQKGSTTRNIYGIYDMSGGSWEYMASFLTNGTNGHVTTMNGKPAKYVEKYAGNGASSSTEDRTANYNANSGIYGDAVYETSNGASGQYSWNSDYSYFPYLTSSFFIRGGSSSYCGFRVVAL